MLNTSDCGILCKKLTSMLQQERDELSRSLQGEILDAYARVVQTELDSLWEIQKGLAILEEKYK